MVNAEMVVLINSTNNSSNNTDDHALLSKIAGGRVDTPYQWSVLRDQVKSALVDIVRKVDTEGVVRRDNSDYTRCLSIIDRLQAPPFTIQRICELLLMESTGSHQQYTRIGDYLRAMVHLLSVETSCTDPSLIGRR